MGKWALIGVILGAIFFGVLFLLGFLGAPHYTDEQKAELNKAFAANCSKCLIQYNVSCTTDELVYSNWGPICGDKYVNRNCTQCRQI